MTTTQNQGLRANLELFKNRDFAILWAGFTFSGLGDSIYYIARIALIIKLTGSALAAGGMTVFGILPTIFMSLTGGALADRLNRQKLVIWSNFARGLIMLVLAWLIYAGLVQYWHLYIVAFINNSFNAISNPAFDAMLPSVVETNKLKNAYSSFSIGSNFAQIAGPALAGLLVLITGTAGAIFVNGLSFFMMTLALMLIRPKVENLETNKKRSSIINDVIEGWVYARKNKTLIIYLISIAFFNLLVPAFVIGIPFYITRILKMNISWYGTTVVGINFGIILGSFLASVWIPKRRGLLVSLGYIIVGIITGFIFGLTGSIWVIVLGMISINIFLGLINVYMPTWIQLTVTDEYRGRVFSIMSMISYSLSPVGLAVFGLLLDHYDANIVISISGIGIVAIGIWMFFQKDMRELH
jgi:MFS transporter, DHA3 family, macrolide efflux protein